MAGDGDPFGEFMQGEEACDEVHTFFDGFYARWNGKGPFELPSGLTDEEQAVRMREMMYYRFGWWLCDVLSKIKYRLIKTNMKE